MGDRTQEQEAKGVMEILIYQKCHIKNMIKEIIEVDELLKTHRICKCCRQV